MQHYHSDNGVFNSKLFKSDMELLGQKFTKSGVGAHHQNTVAERAIGYIMSRARRMLFHMAMMWPAGGGCMELLPFAVTYAVYLWNRIPAIKHGYSPMELFCGTSVNCKKLMRCRVFGCPSYVLNPILQDRKKIPKWQPRSRQGQFLGMSEDHASTIELIRNLQS